MEGIVQSSMTTREVEFVRCVICTPPPHTRIQMPTRDFAWNPGLER